MKKVLSALILTSSLAVLVVPVLLVPTAVSAAVCVTNSCSVAALDCTCGSTALTAANPKYCLNSVAYNLNEEGLNECLAAAGGTTGGTGVGTYRAAPTLITSGQGLLDLITRVGNWIFSILLGIAAIMLILAGFFWATAGGDPANVKKASDMLRNALIGVAVALGAKGLVSVIESLVRG